MLFDLFNDLKFFQPSRPPAKPVDNNPAALKAYRRQ
jgi:hypothetical protein